MKKPLFLITVLLFTVSVSYAQFDDILKKVTKNIAKTDLLEEKNVTTSIEDALPIAFWLKDLHDQIDPVEQENYNFDLGPGYYKFRIQSYCLKAGTHGPTKGSGYLMSPLKGKRSDLVYNIVKNSVIHPEIAQGDIQVLLWGIIYNQKFTDYPLDFQNRVRPLMTASEIVDLSLDIKSLPLEIMPDDVKSIANYYKNLRQKFSDPNATYSDLENMTMLRGVLPEDPFSKFVQKGLWAYTGNGFYIRALPEGYPTTILEIYRPAIINILRDDKGRLTSLERDGYKIDITYDDDPGRDIINFPSTGDFPIWRLKSIRLTGQNPGEEEIIENNGWIVRGNGEVIKNKGGSSRYYKSAGDPIYSEYQGRINSGKQHMKNFNDYQKEKNLQPLKDKQAEYWADYHTMEGLKAATNPLDKKGQISWINKTLNLAKDWWNSASAALSGEDSKDNNPRKPDISRHVAVPATNGMQRLIPSERRQVQ